MSREHMKGGENIISPETKTHGSSSPFGTSFRGSCLCLRLLTGPIRRPGEGPTRDQKAVAILQDCELFLAEPAILYHHHINFASAFFLRFSNNIRLRHLGHNKHNSAKSVVETNADEEFCFTASLRTHFQTWKFEETVKTVG